ncbi:MAG: right-handed parallel beta-helix repeat-containing protein, partial [Candidatus Hodarchaeales archaeon]
YALESQNIEIMNITTISNNYHGIRFENVTNAFITNSNSSYSGITGISMYGSEYINIESSYSSNNSWGIYLFLNEKIYIKNMTVTESTFNGITFDYCNEISLYNNSILNNGVNYTSGIGGWGNNNIEIIGNIVYESSYDGIGVGNSSDMIIKDNIVNHSHAAGISMFYNVTNTLIQSNQIIANGERNWGGVGLYLLEIQNITVINNNITENVYDGIYGGNSSDITIQNNVIHKNRRVGFGGGSGIELMNIANFLINDNQIYSNDGAGIWAANINATVISNNNISYNSLYWGDGITFDRNCTNNLIEHNNIVQNNGIQTYSGSKGVRLKWDSNNNIIRENLIMNHSFEAVYIAFSENNTVYLNDLIDNYKNPTTKQGYSDSDTNAWNNGTHGNFWSDYQGRDDDLDGFGDSPYELEGAEGPFAGISVNADHSPLMNPWVYDGPISLVTPSSTVSTETSVNSIIQSSTPDTSNGSDGGNNINGFAFLISITVILGIIVTRKRNL